MVCAPRIQWTYRFTYSMQNERDRPCSISIAGVDLNCAFMYTHTHTRTYVQMHLNLLCGYTQFYALLRHTYTYARIFLSRCHIAILGDVYTLSLLLYTYTSGIDDRRLAIVKHTQCVLSRKFSTQERSFNEQKSYRCDKQLTMW